MKTTIKPVVIAVAMLVAPSLILRDKPREKPITTPSKVAKLLPTLAAYLTEPVSESRQPVGN